MDINESRARLVSNPKLWDWARDTQIRFLKNRARISPRDYLLDFGCGVLRGGIPLINYLNKGHYYGIEKDPKRLAEGLKELQENNLQHKKPNLGTDFGVIDRPVDVVWAFEVFIHLTDEILSESLKNISAVMKRKARGYATVNLATQKIPDRKWKEYPVVFRPLEFYQNVGKTYGLTFEVLREGNKKTGFSHATLMWHR